MLKIDIFARLGLRIGNFGGLEVSASQITCLYPVLAKYMLIMSLCRLKCLAMYLCLGAGVNSEGEVH